MRRDGARLMLSGPVTLANVAQVLAEGMRELRDGARTVDLGEVTEIDSSLLAAMLAWMREARHEGVEIGFDRLPEGLVTIARLYGVDGLLVGPGAGH
ncbi:MAG TPA: STAS domain-containing protein [Burkholderiales bacterium]|nr:STAS domain-containing protein [Burkholderiales bacterium]